MLWYPADEDGWVLMAEQGSEFYVKEFERVGFTERMLIFVDVYEDMCKCVWFGYGTIAEITTDDSYEIPDLTEENTILRADYIESLGFPPAQPPEGYCFNPWRITNTGLFANFEDGEQALHKFSKMSGFPYANGIFYEEMEDGR